MSTIKKTPAKAAPTKKVVAKTPPKKDAGKRVQKVISLLISVGDEDRERDLESFEADLRAAVKKCGGKMPKGEIRNITKTQEYYIVDGKVCLRQSFDLVTRDFKDGHFPPQWAGGPSEKDIRERMDKQSGKMPAAQDPIHLENLSEAMKSRGAKPKSVATMLDEVRQDRAAVAAPHGKNPANSAKHVGKLIVDVNESRLDDDIEDIDDDIEDIDTDTLDAAADSAVEDFKKVLKKTPPKKVVRRGRK